MHGTRFDSTDYRRCARRLRHVHRRDPARLAHSLRRLSLAYDACAASTPGQSQSASAAPDATPNVRRFAQHVADHLDGPTLRYSERVRLLHEARRLRIRRFDANLIIASVQERVQASGFKVRQGKRNRKWTSCAALFIVVQGLILIGATYVVTS